MRTRGPFTPVAGVLAGVLALLGASAQAVPITSDFESYSDLEVLTTQISGMTFQDAMVLQSGALGGSLNEFDFPPKSGANVLFGFGGPLTIDFAAPMGIFHAFFTYGEQVTILAYDSNLQLLGSMSSAFNENFVSVGGAGNELLTLADLGAFSRLVFSVSSISGTFVMDDLSVTPFADIQSVPEPGTLSLMALGLLGSLIARRRLRRAHAR